MPSPYPQSLAEAEAFLAAHPTIQSFNLIWTGVSGVQRGKLLRREELLGAYKNGRFLPGSIMGIDVNGEDVVETGLVWADGDADRIAWPLPGTLVPVPWIEDTAQFLTALHELDGSPCLIEPRNALARVVERFKARGLTPVAAVEVEFYLMDRAAALAGKPRPPTALVNESRPEHFQCYLMQELDDFQPFFRDLYAGAEAQGLPALTVISEYAPAQMEIVLHHRPDVLKAADEAIMFKRLVRATADKHGLLASFMAKPYSQFTGSGMHIHVSLMDESGRNVFAAEAAEKSPLMLNAIAGLKETMAEAMLIFAPNANSYRRFRLNSYAPVAPNWGVNNRTVSIRVPASTGEAMHIEHRPAGADANPYLVLAAVLAGMHHGIERALDPGPAVVGNGYAQPAPKMPTNWYAATDAFRDGKIMRDYLGEKFVDVFSTIKEVEADRFHAEPSSQDFSWYLRTV
ncbi:MAG: glutamine synthetase family protein [Parvibaculaceae bacterium]